MIEQIQISRDIKLAHRTSGMPQPEDFDIVETALKHNGHDVLVRNRWFRVSISTRLMMSEGIEDIQGIPFPALNLGDTLADAAIGEVLWAPLDSGLQAGCLVLHPLGWREYAQVAVSDCLPLGDGPVDPVAWLGHGWTAYAALTRGVQVRPGDRVFVSSGAGAIGSMAGQIARKLGAARVIGSTSSQQKANWMRAELGYDEVIIRGNGPIATQLAAAAPDGIDVFVDIVGGEQLQAAAAATRKGARIVLLGALSAELDTQGSTKIAPVELDSFHLIVNGVTMRGYSADEDPSAYQEWIQRLGEWQLTGEICLPQSRFFGIESAPNALHDACLGKLKGLALVELY